MIATDGVEWHRERLRGEEAREVTVPLGVVHAGDAVGVEVVWEGCGGRDGGRDGGREGWRS